MARIGRQVNHFKEINKSTIRAEFSEDMLYRYRLDMEYQDNLLRADANERVCVILKNPSSADEKKADATIGKVETYVYKHFPKVKYLSILNMFAIRATDVKEVNQLLKANDASYIIGPNNDKAIETVFKSADHIVCAWGNNNGILPKVYQERIEKIHEFLSKLNKPGWQVIHPKGTKQPLHGLMWGYEYPLERLF